MCGSASERTRAISWGEMVIEEFPGCGGGAAGGNIAALLASRRPGRKRADRRFPRAKLRSSPRGAPRDSKSAFTRVCDALCVAGTPLRGPRGRGSGLGVPGLASLARDTKSWIPAFAGMSGRAESTWTEFALVGGPRVLAQDVPE